MSHFYPWAIPCVPDETLRGINHCSKNRRKKMPVLFTLFEVPLVSAINQKNIFHNRSPIFPLCQLKYHSGWDSKKWTKFVTEIQLEIFLNLFNLIKNNVITIKVMSFKYKNMNLNFGNCEYFLLYHKLLKKIPCSGRDVPDVTRNCDIDFT